jgi:hypothetical protein
LCLAQATQTCDMQLSIFQCIYSLQYTVCLVMYLVHQHAEL